MLSTLGIGSFLLRKWHSFLSLPSYPTQSWYQDRLSGELEELSEATTYLDRLSEESDVFFAISRAKHDGFQLRELPGLSFRNTLVYAYMLGKYTSRWAFYRIAAQRCGAPNSSSVREVVNPGKDDKIEGVAERHGIDGAEFKRACRGLRVWWPLLP